MIATNEIPDPASGIAVVLIRHGQTDDNVPPLRFQGRRDTPLNDEGRRQMAALAARAPRGYEALVSSDLGRARVSAEILGAEWGLRPRVDARFAESHRGRWEGLEMDEVAVAEPERWAAWLTPDAGFQFPEGESLAEHRLRASEALVEVLAGPLPAAVVCHGGTIRLLVQPDIARFHELALPNGAVVALDRSGRPLEPVR